MYPASSPRPAARPERALVSSVLFGLGVLTVALLILSGCGSKTSESADDTADGPTYRMGAPLTDARYALVIDSEYGTDTLSAALFREQFQRFVQQIPAVALDDEQGRELRRGIAEEFVRRHVLRGEADRRGITADTAVVNSQLDMIRARVGGPEELERRLAERNLTLDSLRQSIAEDLRMQLLGEQLVADAPEPTPEELDAFRKEQAGQVSAQHILFRTTDPATRDETLALANAVLDSIKAGADFAEMAGRYGTDGTAQRGGDLGFFSRNEMVEPFAEAAFALADSGDVAPALVETQFGHHIIRLTGRRTVDLMDEEQARAFLMQERQQESYNNAYNTLLSQVTIHANGDILGVDLNEPAGS